MPTLLDDVIIDLSSDTLITTNASRKLKVDVNAALGDILLSDNIVRSIGWYSDVSIVTVRSDVSEPYILYIEINPVNGNSQQDELEIEYEVVDNTETVLSTGKVLVENITFASMPTIIPVLSIDSTKLIATFSKTQTDIYHLQISTDPDFGELIVDADVTNMPINFSAFIELIGQPYYARIKNENGALDTSWSKVVTFTVFSIPSQPIITLSDPVFNRDTENYELSFAVSGSNGASFNYNLFVNVGDTDGWQQVRDGDIVPGDGTYTLPLSIQNSGGYAYKLLIGGSWFTETKTLIVNTLPLLDAVTSTPGTLIPQLSIDSKNKVAFFSNTGSTNGYSFQIGTTSGGNDVLDMVISSSPLNFGAFVSSSDNLYYAQVRNGDSSTSTDWCDVISFKVTSETVQPKVSLLNPVYNETINSYELPFVVNNSDGVIVNYQLYINNGDDSGWQAQINTDSVNGDGTYKIPLFILHSGGYLYKLNINSFWYTNTVSIILNTLPIQDEVLGSPGSLTPILSIDSINMIATYSVTGSETFYLQIATTSDFSGTLAFDGNASSPFDFTDYVYAEATPYYARVKNDDSGVNTSWSESMEFNILAMKPKSVVISDAYFDSPVYKLPINVTGSGNVISYQLWVEESGVWTAEGTISTIISNMITELTLPSLSLTSGTYTVKLRINESWYTNTATLVIT